MFLIYALLTQPKATELLMKICNFSQLFKNQNKGKKTKVI